MDLRSRKGGPWKRLVGWFSQRTRVTFSYRKLRYNCLSYNASGFRKKLPCARTLNAVRFFRSFQRAPRFSAVEAKFERCISYCSGVDVTDSLATRSIIVPSNWHQQYGCVETTKRPHRAASASGQCPFRVLTAPCPYVSLSLTDRSSCDLSRSPRSLCLLPSDIGVYAPLVFHRACGNLVWASVKCVYLFILFGYIGPLVYKECSEYV